nr:PREDICTED: uncharacterized protein LOC108951454 [Musa acuminata subsp. malaccensis]
MTGIFLGRSSRLLRWPITVFRLGRGRCFHREGTPACAFGGRPPPSHLHKGRVGELDPIPLTINNCSTGHEKQASKGDRGHTRVTNKRRTWVYLFLLFYTLLLHCSWGLLLAIHSWYNIVASSSSSSSSWSSRLYTSVLYYGELFGMLSVGAALPVAVPATLVTCCTVLVLLAFAGKPWRALVMEGRRITADISAVALKILVREGNLVTGGCAGLSFVAILLSSRRGEHDL